MIVILIVINDHVDDAYPTVEGAAGADEEVVTVEDLEDVGFELFEED